MGLRVGAIATSWQPGTKRYPHSMKFSVYLFNPETDAKPRMQAYELPDDCGAVMLLDALLLLKQQDDSLSFRRSCREGVCGSDGMNINGRNGLACILQLDTLKQPITLRRSEEHTSE